MARDSMNDILVFLAVARERSFTRAAAKPGMTRSALSHIVRSPQARLGVRLTADVPVRIVGAPAYFERRPRPPRPPT